ncbi:MAG: O-acetyl-ADP-ribose deacetylase [Myxococcota bacterium]
MSAAIRIDRGDLTQADVDAIVNAANERMLGGGGVDGAIHRAAGPALLEACRAVPEVRPGVRCPTGEARITPGFSLLARHVIHTVGPIYGENSDDAALLASAFRNSLELALSKHLRSIAFPAISCGVYGYPVREAATVAASVIGERAWALDEIRFVLFSDAVFDAWRAAFPDSEARDPA